MPLRLCVFDSFGCVLKDGKDLLNFLDFRLFEGGWKFLFVRFSNENDRHVLLPPRFANPQLSIRVFIFMS